MEKSTISIKCEIHPNMCGMYFCKAKKCKILICDDCLPSHSSHNYVHLLELANEMKALQNAFQDESYETTQIGVFVPNIFHSITTKMETLFGSSLSKMNYFKNKVREIYFPYWINPLLGIESIIETTENEDLDKMQEIFKLQLKMDKSIKNLKDEAKLTMKELENIDPFLQDIKENASIIKARIAENILPPELRVLLLGLDYSGKTTFLYKMQSEGITTTIPIIGVNVETMTYKNINITSWDSAANTRLWTLFRHYINNKNLLVLMIDASDRERFAEVKELLDGLLEEESLSSVPLLVIGNKIDLPGAATSHEIKQALRLDEKIDHIWEINMIAATTLDQASCLQQFKWALDLLTQGYFINSQYIYIYIQRTTQLASLTQISNQLDTISSEQKYLQSSFATTMKYINWIVNYLIFTKSPNNHNNIQYSKKLINRQIIEKNVPFRKPSKSLG